MLIYKPTIPFHTKPLQNKEPAKPYSSLIQNTLAEDKLCLTKPTPENKVSFGAFLIDDAIAVAVFVAVAAFGLVSNLKVHGNAKEKFKAAEDFTNILMEKNLDTYILKAHSPEKALDYLKMSKIEDPIIIGKHLHLVADIMRAKLDTYSSDKDKQKALEFIKTASVLRDVLFQDLYVNYVDEAYSKTQVKPEDLDKAIRTAKEVLSPKGIDKMATMLADINTYKDYTNNKKSPEIQNIFRFIKHKEVMQAVLEKTIAKIDQQIQASPDDKDLKKLGIMIGYLSMINTCNETQKALDTMTEDQKRFLADQTIDTIENMSDFFDRFINIPKHLRDEIISNPQKAWQSRTSLNLANDVCEYLGVSHKDLVTQKQIFSSFQKMDEMGIHHVDCRHAISQWRTGLLEKESIQKVSPDTPDGNPLKSISAAMLLLKVANDCTGDAKLSYKARQAGVDTGIGLTKIYTSPARAGFHWGSAASAFSSGAAAGASAGMILGPPGAVVGGLTAGVASGALMFLLTTSVENQGWDFMEKLLKGEAFPYPYFDDAEKTEFVKYRSDARNEIRPESPSESGSANPLLCESVKFICKAGEIAGYPDPKSIQKDVNDIITGKSTVTDKAKWHSIDDSIVQNWVNKYTLNTIANELKKY